MSQGKSRATMVTILVLLFLLPVVATVLAWLDATRWHYVLIREGPSDVAPELSDANLEELKQSILNVQVLSCDGEGGRSGTSFVIKAGFVATAAHVVKDHQACSSPITLVDYRGRKHQAQISGYSDETELDLAILSFPDLELIPLPLADSTLFEGAGAMVEVITIGYPPTASTSDEAAVSGIGSLSSFRDNRFFTSGMDLNPGNSGGPVLLTSDWTVLGVASQKGDATQGHEGLGVVVPSEALSRFFQDRVGQPL
ncbi:MAG: serine protease [Deltaproteobacteria bacterium]|nr:serine protease [Deltaproteobacteria bacterium]